MKHYFVKHQYRFTKDFKHKKYINFVIFKWTYIVYICPLMFLCHPRLIVDQSKIAACTNKRNSNINVLRLQTKKH